VHFREYSPGLLSSILIWMDYYFIVRYRPLAERIAPRTRWLAALASSVDEPAAFVHAGTSRRVASSLMVARILGVSFS
jgi:hypothetical protein